MSVPRECPTDEGPGAGAVRRRHDRVAEKRLRWHCRRGTRELDILLRNFLEIHYEHISSRQQTCFLDLLGESDLDIMVWIGTPDRAPREDYYRLIQLIRQSSGTDVSAIAPDTDMR